MVDSYLGFKVIIIILFGVFYYFIYKKIFRIEEKILYWNFFILFYLGGSLSALIFEYTEILFPYSGILKIQTSYYIWSVYFFIVFLIPAVSIFLFKIIFIAFKSKKNKYSNINLFILYMSIFISMVYIYMNTNIIDSIVNKGYSGYVESLIFRYNLSYAKSFVFIARPLMFVLLLALSFEYYYRGKIKKSFFIFIIGLIIYGVIDVFLFISKLYFIGFIFAYLIFLLIHIKRKHFILISLVFAILYTLFYFYNMYNLQADYTSNIIEPILKGLTRFTLQVPYYIYYYTFHNFDMNFYNLNPIWGGKLDASPNIRVFTTMYDYNGFIEGSLASGLFLYNYTSFWIFSIFKSIFDMAVLLSLYVMMSKNLSSFKLSILFLLIFGVMNYSFTGITRNVLVGFFYFVFFYFIINFLKYLLSLYISKTKKGHISGSVVK